MFLGIFLSVTASILFGILYYYSTFLNPLNGQDIFAWRMLLTVPVAVIFIAAIGENKSVKKRRQLETKYLVKLQKQRN